jgi:hypothetical protein
MNKKTTRLDHFLYGTSDLHATAAEFSERTGVQPVFGGVHPDLGTANYLISLGYGMYLELIGPTPGEKPKALGIALSHFDAPALYWYALRSNTIGEVLSGLDALGMKTTQPVAGMRTTSDGQQISWMLAEAFGHSFGGCMPFLIDWQESTHPSESTEPSLQFQRFELSHPDADGLNAVFAGIGLPCQVSTGEPHMSLGLCGPRGDFELSGSGQMPWFGPKRSGVFDHS